MVHFVTSYPNPDLDGIASAIVRAWMLRASDGIEARAVYFGELDRETTFVLNTLEIEYPQLVSSCPPDRPVHLVDTHHLIQITGYLSGQQVQSIIDHHPAGDAAAFPNAAITNEFVGAAATIIEERIVELGLAISPQMARLLHSAILSNTLYFSASTATSRDRDAAARLEALAPMPAGFVKGMITARSGVIDTTTRELVALDYKEFELGVAVVGISQLELGAAELVLERPDLDESLRQFEMMHSGAVFVFLSVVDFVSRETTVVAVSELARRAVSAIFGVPFSGSRLHFDRVLLRKSDFIPQLKTMFEGGIPDTWRDIG